jgi:hypothetical protein
MMQRLATVAALALPATLAAPTRAPNYHGCLTPLAKSFAYCNLNSTHDQRAQVRQHFTI